MSKYSQSQAKAKAQMVVSQLGTLILAATAGTGFDPAFLAGKIGVEAGVKGGKIVESATRFESGVFEDLKSLRDKGYCFVGGKKRTTYSGVKRSQIADASDKALRALATSYGVSQIMGWHMVNNLKGTINDLRDPQKHLVYTVQLLKIVAPKDLAAKEYGDVLRIWNTGRENGKTYDPNYVHNALAIMEAAAPLLKALKTSQKQEPGSAAARAAKSDNIISQIGADDVDLDDGNQPGYDGIDPDDNADFDQQQSLNQIPDPPAQQADNIINLGDGAGGSAKPEPPKNQPTDVSMDAPAAEGIKAKVSRWYKALGFGVPTGAGLIAAIKTAQEDGTIKFGEVLSIMLQTFLTVLPSITYIIIAYLIYRTIKTVMIQFSFNKRMEINGNPDLNNIRINQPPKAAEEPKSLFSRIF